MTMIRSLGKLAAVATLASVASLPAQPARETTDRHEEPNEFAWFAKRLGTHSSRMYVTSEAADHSAQIDADRLGQAIEQSVRWINRMLKPEFVPEDLESLIEAIPAGMEGRRHPVRGDTGTRFDCTTAGFEKGGYRFLVTQDELVIAFFVLPVNVVASDRVHKPSELAKFLERRSEELFNHAAASFYDRAIALTDYGVELDAAWHAQYPDVRYKGWKSTVLVPPKACEDGVMTPAGLPDRKAIAKKLRALDSTIPQKDLEGFDSFWWGSIYASTDGRILYYSATKTNGGQGIAYVPDWFRVAKPGEIPEIGNKVQPSAPADDPSPPK